MNERAFRCSPILILVLSLLMALPAAAAEREGPRIPPQARAPFAAVAPAQAASCGVCAAAFQRCSATCFGRGDKAGMGACLTACDNAAAACACDEKVGLRSEDLVDFAWPNVTKTACHGNVSCQPNYPSCAGWSGYSDCGDAWCGFGGRCGGCYCDEYYFCDCDPGPLWISYQERFRVCFDQYGNSCTEWQQISSSYCGC